MKYFLSCPFLYFSTVKLKHRWTPNFTSNKLFYSILFYSILFYVKCLTTRTIFWGQRSPRYWGFAGRWERKGWERKIERKREGGGENFDDGVKLCPTVRDRLAELCQFFILRISRGGASFICIDNTPHQQPFFEKSNFSRYFFYIVKRLGINRYFGGMYTAESK